MAETNTNTVIQGLLDKSKGTGCNIHAMGEALIAGLDAEERAKIRSKCSTLHFVKLLKLDSRRADRMIAGNETCVSHKAVGIVLVSDEDISVPDIPGEYDKSTGVPPEVIKMVKKAAREEFYLTYYEFMFLMLRKEFAGFCSRDNDPYGVYFSPKMPKFKSNEMKLPTPTVNFSQAGSPKELMEAVDVFDVQTKRWTIKPEYADKFGSYLPTIVPQRKQGDSEKFPTSTNASLGLAEELKKRYGYDSF